MKDFFETHYKNIKKKKMLRNVYKKRILMFMKCIFEFIRKCILLKSEVVPLQTWLLVLATSSFLTSFYNLLSSSNGFDIFILHLKLPSTSINHPILYKKVSVSYSTLHTP